MTRRAFRVLLFLGLLGAAALAGYQGWRLERARVQQLASASAFDTITLRLAQSVIDLRASERAYVSSGQGFAFWKPRVDSLLQQIRQDLTSLKSSTAPGAEQTADAALDALNEAARLEGRIAEAAEAGRIPFAADLVYADGVQASLALERATNAAIASARSDLDAYQRDARVQELLLAAVSACIGLFLALMWYPSQQRPVGANTPAPSVDATGNATATPARGSTTLGVGHLAGAAKAEDTGTRFDLPLRLGPEAARGATRPAGAPGSATRSNAGAGAASTGNASSTGRAAGAGRAPGAASAGAASAGAGSSTEAVSAARGGGADAPLSTPAAGATPVPREALTAVADLCTSLARVTEPQELSGLLAQMSAQLDAAGVIVWLATSDGLSLRPALSHGYTPEALARLDRLDLASDNATARAFRLARPQTVSARDSIPGAIVVPLSTGAGCVGAVAAELRHGRERDAATMALARIFAAQLATLTGPAAESSSSSAAASS